MLPNSSPQEELGIALAVLFKPSADPERRVEAAATIAGNRAYCWQLGDERFAALLDLTQSAGLPSLQRETALILGYRWCEQPALHDFLSKCLASPADNMHRIEGLLDGADRRWIDHSDGKRQVDLGGLLARVPELFQGAAAPQYARRSLFLAREWVSQSSNPALSPDACASWISALERFREGGFRTIFAEDRPLAKGLTLDILNLLRGQPQEEPPAQSRALEDFRDILFEPGRQSKIQRLGYAVAAEVRRQGHSPESVLIELCRENRRLGFLDVVGEEVQPNLPTLLAALRAERQLDFVLLPVPPGVWDEFQAAGLAGDEERLYACLAGRGNFSFDFARDSKLVETVRNIFSIPDLTCLPCGADFGLTRQGDYVYEQELERICRVCRSAGNANMVAINCGELGFDFKFSREHLDLQGARSLRAGVVGQEPQWERRIWSARVAHQSDFLVDSSLFSPSLGEFFEAGGVGRSFGLRLQASERIWREPFHSDFSHQSWADNWDALALYFDNDPGEGHELPDDVPSAACGGPRRIAFQR